MTVLLGVVLPITPTQFLRLTKSFNFRRHVRSAPYPESRVVAFEDPDRGIGLRALRISRRAERPVAGDPLHSYFCREHVPRRFLGGLRSSLVLAAGGTVTNRENERQKGNVEMSRSLHGMPVRTALRPIRPVKEVLRVRRGNVYAKAAIILLAKKRRASIWLRSDRRDINCRRVLPARDLSDTSSSLANLPFLHRRLHWLPVESMGPADAKMTKGGICHDASNYRFDCGLSYYWYCDNLNRYLCPRACRDDSPSPRAPPSSHCPS
jgi:hypothetical protein